MADFGSIWDDIKHSYRTGNMVTRLVMVNFAVFVAVNLFKFVAWGTTGGDHLPGYFYTVLHLFCMPAQWFTFLTHPWGIITSMFLHEGFLHLVANVSFLLIFGRIVGDLIGDRRVLPIYLLGGMVGSLLFLLSDFWVHYEVPYALGASGAVMALAGAVLILAPDYRVMLLLLGEVKAKYIVLVMVLLDLIGIVHSSNTGGHIAHIGGFAMGCLIIFRLRDGRDVAEPVNRILDKIGGWFGGGRSGRPTRRKPQMAYRSPFGGSKGQAVTDQEDLSFQEKLDAILDKIKEKGYEKLTPEEKEFLYKASRK